MEFDAWIQGVDIDKEIKVVYSTVGSLMSNTMDQCSFQPQQLLVSDSLKNCEGISLSGMAT